jgi:hypothetical protein
MRAASPVLNYLLATLSIGTSYDVQGVGRSTSLSAFGISGQSDYNELKNMTISSLRIPMSRSRRMAAATRHPIRWSCGCGTVTVEMEITMGGRALYRMPKLRA